MADFDMTGWEEISPEEVGVYINDKNDSINASNFDDATDVRYKYNTGIEREDNWKFIGKTKITGELAELQRNIFSSAGRGVFNGIVGMARGVASEAVSTGQLIESGVSDIALRAAGANQQYRKQYSERLNEAYGALDGKLRKWIDTLTLSQDQKDQEVAYNLGAAVGNVIGTIGVAFATKNPKLVFGVMGVSASGDIKSELRDKGANIYKSSLIGTSLGAFMGASEKIGAEPILNALGKKIVVDQLFKKKALKVLAKSGVSEGLEEFTQNTVEDAVMKALGYRDKTVTQIMKDGLEGAAYGAFGGLFGGGVFMPAMIQAKKDTKQKLVDAGLEESKADELADSIVYDQKEVEDAVSELMEKEADQETLTNGSYEEDTKRFSDALKQDFLAEEFEIQETAKQKMIEAGHSEEDAQGYAVMISNFARNISRITGQTPREVWEEKGLNLINENYPQPNDVEISESELTPEEKAKADELDVPFQTDILRPGDEGYEQNLKEKQLNIILSENPMYDDYHLGIRKLEDIKTFEEVIDDEESFVWGDFSREEAKEALKKGEITVYSSYPIKNGVFVSTSYIQAEEYAGGKGGKVYSKTVPLDRVAWINGDEGEFADTSTEFYQTDEVRPSDKEYLDIAKQNEELDKTNPAYEGETININGTDRTVYNSAGERIAKSEAALRNFYNWFGDSKVVDSEGRPLVVYHGTNTKFDTFKKELRGQTTSAKSAKKGFFFTSSKEVAEDYAEYASQGAYLWDEVQKLEKQRKFEEAEELTRKLENGEIELYPEVMPVYLKSSNILEVDFKGKRYDATKDNLSSYIDEAISLNKDGIVFVNIIDNAYDETTSSNQYVVFESNQIKSTENRGTFSLQEDNIYYQFTGENSLTAPIEQLNEAKRLEKENTNMEEIRKTTGWFKGIDRKWRFEISDADAKIRTDVIENIMSEDNAREKRKNLLWEIDDLKKEKEKNAELYPDGYIDEMISNRYDQIEKIDYDLDHGYIPQSETTLGEVLKHDKLYEAYPALKNITVSIKDMEGSTAAYYNERNNNIVLNYRFADSKDLKSTLLHEIQHYIQKKEGFARGGNKDSVIKTILNESGKLHNTADYNAYERAMADYTIAVDAYNVAEVSTNPERVTKKVWYQEHGSWFAPRKRTKYRKEYINKKASEYVKEIHSHYVNDALYDEAEKYMELVSKDIKDINKAYKSAKAKLNRATDKLNLRKIAKYESLVDQIENNKITGYELYERLFGEIEARNTEARMDMTEEERREISPESTQDISSSDAIVVMGDTILTSFKENAPKQIKRGSYTPTKNLITLFKTSNRSTIIHELGHYFTINYVNVLEERGLQDELKGFYDWLGIKNINEATTETWERMARGFETYAMEGVAPNVSTQSLFARMKQWLVDVYSDIKGNLIAPEEINDDVREFFDKMLTSEQEVFDLSSLTGKTQEINDIIKNILQGQEVDFQGFSVKDLEHLVKAVNMRLPKLPKNLEQAIRKAGGIDIEFAKAIGIYDEKKGNMHGFFKKNGAIKKEDALIEFLKDKAYLVLEDAKTYGETAEIMDRVTYLLEDAANAYSENDLEYINDRNAISEVIDEASRILQDINYEDITKALKVIKENDAVIVNKNTLEYMKARVKRIEKDHKKVVKEIRKKQKDLDLMRSDVSTYIKEQPISADHKLRLLNKVKNIKDEESFINVVNEVKDRAKDFYLQEQKKLLSTQIHKEIKKSRPKRVTQQKYDYERNVLFKDLRDYDKLTKEKAGEAIINLLAKEDKTETDLIRMRFLNYKANGMSSSTQLMEKVLDDIRSMKQLGSQIKDQADLEAKINREELKQNVMEAIANNKADKNTTKTAIGNLYRKGFTNLYSMINSITSKALADKFEMATVLNDAEVDYFVHTKKVTERMIKLFGLKSKGDLLNKFAELGERVGTLTTINESGNSYEISKMDVIDIYNSMKNEKKRADYIQAYGEPQIMRFVNMLNDKERLMADEMMEDVNSFFPETNKVYVETYGMDLKKVENYWPATSEHSETTDLLADFYAQQETPSFYKERAGGRVVPVPKNAWAKYLKHINESIYMIKIARKYKTIRDTFKSSRVRNRIENKYGKDIYAELMKQIEAISLNARSADLNFVEQVWGKFFNNFVVAKIAVAPTVLAGQFTAITNYAENVDTAEFYKQFTKGLANPKETIEFMQKYEKDFMETRFAGGYSEAVSRVLADAGKANNQRFKIISDKTKFDSINALTYFVRIGDLGSVMFGGYAQIQADLKAGVPLEKALHRFEEQTITSQQSSNKAALSSLQQTTGLGRILLAFKNTAHQYLRKVADSIIQYQRGEITANQCAKVVLNYAVVQPTLYILAKNAVKAALGLDDDDDSIFDGLPETLLLGIFDAVPIVSDILHTTYKGLTGGYISHILSTPGLDDIENSIRVLFKKKDKGVFDWVEVVAPLIEGTTSIPVARYGTMFEKWEED